MRVIKIINGVITDIKNVTDGYLLEEGEIESETGELGQLQMEDGTFIDPEPIQITPEVTLEDKINFIYYKQMGVL
ncbi:hypothetical protein [Rummeliibacillus stabekisii]|uniref:hypothetical protein n=1 Tax=Rummeliibacillus stabekisii TaxID=241244 RepID=UPI0037246200